MNDKKESLAVELVARMIDAGIKNPWDFISEEAKDRLAWLRFYRNLLTPIQDGE